MKKKILENKSKLEEIQDKIIETYKKEISLHNNKNINFAELLNKI